MLIPLTFRTPAWVGMTVQTLADANPAMKLFGGRPFESLPVLFCHLLISMVDTTSKLT